MKKTLLYIFFFLPSFILAWPQDSVSVKSASSSIISNKFDTTAVSDSTKKKSKRWDINAVINATASDSLVFKVKDKRMELYGSGEMKYKKSDLKSARICVDFSKNKIIGEGIPDTADKTGKKLMGTPVMMDGGETYEGTRLTYDYKTLQGFISLAKTKSEGTAYGGEKVRKMDKETYFIENGIYTTCTDDTQHYNFYAKQMKVIMKEQIIARWIWLYVGGVPFPIPLPFAAFPTQSGRRSGIIAPAYGQSNERGWYLSHLGYFWAINDYIDLNSTMDYYFKGGFNVNSRFRYAKRYSLSGNIEGGYSNLHSGEKTDPDYTRQKNWRFSLTHNQQIDPTTKLDANITFTSGKNYYSNNYVDYNNLLQQNIVSNATLFKSWEESGNYLSINYERSQNLSTGDISEILPNINFSIPQSYPFKRKGNTDAANQKWYELIGYEYSGRFLNKRNKTGNDLEIRGGIEHNINVSASPKVGYINISPRVSYSEKWYNKKIEQGFESFPVYDKNGNITGTKDSLVTKDIHQINMVRNFDFSLTASTKLYGIVQPNALGIDAIRHTITPSISYNYQPDFSETKWGYYGSYKDTSGRIVKYDKFGKEVFSGSGSGESQSISLSIGNNFEMKTKKDPTDTTSQARKIQLLNLSASVNYNFAADSLKLSDLSLSYRTQVGEFLSFYGSSNYSFYEYNKTQKINKFLVSNNKGLLKMTNFSFAVSTSISGEKLKSKEEKQKKEDEEENEAAAFKKKQEKGLYNDEEPDFEIPWDISMNYNYSFNKISSYKSSNVNFSLNTNLTKTWKLSLSAYYDIFNKKFQAPAVNIYKDLHCWEMKITWNPLGAYQGYRFEIRLKASQLKDLKVEGRGGQFQRTGY